MAEMDKLTEIAKKAMETVAKKADSESIDNDLLVKSARVIAYDNDTYKTTIQFLDDINGHEYILYNKTGEVLSEGDNVRVYYTSNPAKGWIGMRVGEPDIPEFEGGVGKRSAWDSTSEYFNAYDGEFANIAGTSPNKNLFAHAEGIQTKALGHGSHSEGRTTVAYGGGSHVEGDMCETYGNSSHAEGSNCKAYGEASHVEGGSCQANGMFSHSEGSGCNASGQCSHAEGYNSVASGMYSHAENMGQTSTMYSHAEGTSIVEGYGDYGHAEGYECTVTGFCSHAEGEFNEVSGRFTHIEGYDNTASGDFSHVGGSGCVSDNHHTFVHGTDLTSFNTFQTVIGHNNNPTIPDTMDDYCYFVIGNNSVNTGGNGLTFDFQNNLKIAGTYQTIGADYAEFFEWVDGNINNEDRRGLFVTLDGEKIRIANTNDTYIVGVISAQPSVIGDSFDLHWQGQFLSDIYGAVLTEEIIVPAEYDDENGEKRLIMPEHKELKPLLNPNYNPSMKYISRSRRPEWSPVGMKGKLVVRDNGECVINSYCKSGNGGIAIPSENGYRVMARLDDSHIKVLI